MRYGPKLAFPRTEPALIALRESLRSSGEWLRQEVGVFQYLDSPMPALAYVIWAGAVLLLLLAALRRGAVRDRLAVVLTVAVAFTTPVLLHAFVLRPIGWEVQGRHVLPVAVVVPLIAGEIAARRAGPHRGRPWMFAIAAAAAVQLAQYWTTG